MITRNILIALFCVLMLISCTPQNLTTPDYQLETIRINKSNQINFAPIFFAESDGSLNQYGIQLELLPFNIPPQAIPLLASGQLDVYAGPISSGLINTLGQEPYVKVVADRGQIVQGDCTFQAILVRKDLFESGKVTSAQDLAGLTIAASKTSAVGYQLGTFLNQAGLTFDDVFLSDIPSSSYIEAFSSKTLDAITVPEYNLTRLLLDGNAVVISRIEDILVPYQISVLAFGRRLTHDNPDLGVRFLAAYLKGVQKYNQGKTEENLKILADKTGEDIELLRQVCWIPIRTDGIIDFAGVDPFQKWSVKQGQLDITVTEEQFWDPRFLEEAFTLLKKEN